MGRHKGKRHSPGQAIESISETHSDLSKLVCLGPRERMLVDEIAHHCDLGTGMCVNTIHTI